MVIGLTEFLNAVSHATDFAASAVLNVPRHHARRVAVLTNRIAADMGLDEKTVFALTQAAILHDCALNEYLSDEVGEDGEGGLNEHDMAAHCEAGEKMLLHFPFYSRIRGAVLYHHDRADGLGAMGRRADATPIFAQIIHIADAADTNYHLAEMDPSKYESMMAWIRDGEDTVFSAECVRAFEETVTYDLLMSITGDRCVETLAGLVPDVEMDLPVHLIRQMSMIFADITDYKSHFTWRHSLGIAEKAERLGGFYGYDEEKCDKLYIAGALHDIGKLLIPNDILEKPGKLTNEEYKEITNHALGTWDILKNIKGMEDITRWAALHHEKLDGSGYPFGYTAADLSREERMMACLDIYQALVEERPYKHGMSHQEAISILRKMGFAGQLDSAVIEDINTCYALHCEDQSCMIAMREEAPRDFEGEAWRCPVCGYIHEGELPEDFICPRCEQPASVFEKIN